MFLVLLFLGLKQIKNKFTLKNGELFKLFILVYFAFRFLIEFLKPNVFFTFGLSSIQILCVICWLYFSKFIVKNLKNASKKLHLL